MADITSAATTARDTVGRYFTLVSVLPSVLLVLWVLVLARSGAWSGTPDFAAAMRSFTTIGVWQSVLLVAAAFAVGAVLHPVQFALVQTLEGYWGTSTVAQRLAETRIRHHRERIDKIRQKADKLTDEIDDRKEQLARASGPRGTVPPGDVDMFTARDEQLRDEIRRRRVHADELDRISDYYPYNLEEFLPTRLGNVLRRYERNVGNPYGLDAVVSLPYLSRVAAPGDMDHVNDQRSQLDLAARFTVVSGMATSVTILFLARHGMWLLVALVPYVASYLSYRGCIVLAAEYGRSFGVLLTLNRFALYERLELPRPHDTTDERRLNRELDAFLRHVRHEQANLTYRPPSRSDDVGDDPVP